jgi:hypothetical protein
MAAVLLDSAETTVSSMYFDLYMSKANLALISDALAIEARALPNDDTKSSETKVVGTEFGSKTRPAHRLLLVFIA